MERKYCASCQVKEGRKRRQRNYLLLSLQANIFLFLISLLTVRILNQTTSPIILTISGTGVQQLINGGFKDSISEVLVNGIQDPSCSDTCNLGGTTNTITLQITGPLTFCNNMFKDRNNIISVDLSNFDGSQV